MSESYRIVEKDFGFRLEMPNGVYFDCLASEHPEEINREMLKQSSQLIADANRGRKRIGDMGEPDCLDHDAEQVQPRPRLTEAQQGEIVAYLQTWIASNDSLELDDHLCTVMTEVIRRTIAEVERVSREAE